MSSSLPSSSSGVDTASWGPADDSTAGTGERASAVALSAEFGSAFSVHWSACRGTGASMGPSEISGAGSHALASVEPFTLGFFFANRELQRGLFFPELGLAVLAPGIPSGGSCSRGSAAGTWSGSGAIQIPPTGVGATGTPQPSGMPAGLSPSVTPACDGTAASLGVSLDMAETGAMSGSVTASQLLPLDEKRELHKGFVPSDCPVGSSAGAGTSSGTESVTGTLSGTFSSAAGATESSDNPIGRGESEAGVASSPVDCSPGAGAGLSSRVGTGSSAGEGAGSSAEGGAGGSDESAGSLSSLGAFFPKSDPQREGFFFLSDFAAATAGTIAAAAPRGAQLNF